MGAASGTDRPFVRWVADFQKKKGGEGGANGVAPVGERAVEAREDLYWKCHRALLVRSSFCVNHDRLLPRDTDAHPWFCAPQKPTCIPFDVATPQCVCKKYREV